MNNLPQLRVRLLAHVTCLWGQQQRHQCADPHLLFFFWHYYHQEQAKARCGSQGCRSLPLRCMFGVQTLCGYSLSCSVSNNNNKTNKQTKYTQKQTEKNETNLYLSQIKDSCGFDVLFCFIFPFIYFYFFPKGQSSWDAPVNFLSGQQEDLLLWLLILLFFFASSFFFWFFLLWSIPVYFYALGENSSHLAA